MNGIPGIAILLIMLDALAIRPGRETAGWLALIRPRRRRNVACAAGDAEEGRRRGSNETSPTSVSYSPSRKAYHSTHT